MSGHQGFVLGVRFDGAGERLYSASIEGDICAWDPRARTLESAWRAHRSAILDLCWRGELFTAGLDGTVGIWGQDGALVRRLEGHAAGVHGIAASAQLVASASADGRIGVWDRQTGVLRRFLEGHDETVTAVAFLDDRTLASGSRDRTVRTWDLRSGTQLKVLEGHDWWITKLYKVADERVLSASEDGTLRLWDPHSGDVHWVFRASGEPIWGMAVGAGGRLAVASCGGEVVRVDLDAHSSETLPHALPISGRAVTFSPDATLLAIGQDWGDIDLIDLNERVFAGRLHGVGCRVLSGVLRDGLIATGGIGGEVESVDAGGTTTAHAGHDSFVYAGRRLSEKTFATGAFDNRVKIWEQGVEAPRLEFDHGALVFSLSADRAGRLLAGGGDRITMWNVAQQEVVWAHDNTGIGTHLVATFGADDHVIAAVGEAPILRVWPLAGGTVRSWPLPDAHNCVIEAVPGSSRVVVGSAYGRVSMVDLEHGSSRPLHDVHEDWIRSARLAPDGGRLVTVSQNGSACVFDLVRDRLTERLAGDCVVLADFTEDGALLWMDGLGEVHRE
jgi:WD40 repeat protein